jgi:hypothetical protein
LLVLAQSAPPLVPASSEPRVDRTATQVCVIETLPEGGETRHCRPRGQDYAGRPLDAPTVSTAPEPDGDAEPPSQFGIAMTLGSGIPVSTGSLAVSSTVHGRIGFRYALLSRAQDPGRSNLALALLIGGDIETDHAKLGAAFEARVEATVGGHRRFLEPTLDLFFAAGVQHANAGLTPEFHLGAGIGLDLFLSKLFDTPTHDSPATVLLPLGVAPPFALAAVFLLTPTAQYRYVMRADGSRFSEVVLSIGL